MPIKNGGTLKLIIKLTLIRFYFHRNFFGGLSFLLRLRARFVFIKIKNIRRSFVFYVLLLSSLFSFVFHFVVATIGTVLFWTLYSERGLSNWIQIDLSCWWYSVIMLSNLCFANITWSFLDRQRASFSSLTGSRHWLIITSFYTFLSHHGYV